jgi:hypothetical protein
MLTHLDDDVWYTNSVEGSHYYTYAYPPWRDCNPTRDIDEFSRVRRAIPRDDAKLNDRSG